MSIAHDPYVSRHHFLLLINPPEVRLRNLSDTNGTLVDGVLYTQGDALDPTSEAKTLVKSTALAKGAEAILRNGSEIEAGYSRITVAVESSSYCVECGQAMPSGAAAADSEVPLCAECEAKRPESVMLVKTRAEAHGEKQAKHLAPAPVASGTGSVQRMIRDIVRERGSPARAFPDIPGFQIQRKLAEGGMGVVFEATEVAGGRKVAIKTVRPDRLRNRELRSRFKREINITKMLAHPNIISLIDFGETNRILWFAMEFIEGGRDIEKRLKEAGGRLPWSECMELVLGALEGLAYAHGRGIVHRDLKPSNILLARGARETIAQITDFGISKSLEDVGMNGSVLSRPASAMGTLPFMPPEQARDVRTSTSTADVFSMGATLYLMLTGRLIRDFPKNFNEAIRQVLSVPPVPVLRHDASIPKRIAEVVDKALRMEPAERHPDAGAFRDALRGAV